MSGIGLRAWTGSSKWATKKSKASLVPASLPLYTFSTNLANSRSNSNRHSFRCCSFFHLELPNNPLESFVHPVSSFPLETFHIYQFATFLPAGINF